MEKIFEIYLIICGIIISLIILAGLIVFLVNAVIFVIENIIGYKKCVRFLKMYRKIMSDKISLEKLEEYRNYINEKENK